MSVNYAEVIEYVKKMTSENGRPSNYPFRSRFEHTMRVYRWAIKLQSKLGGDLDVIVLAALLHDIGWDDERPHGEVGAELAVEYMDSIGIDPFNDPNKQKYIDKFVELRSKKGVTPEMAKEQMEKDYMY